MMPRDWLGWLGCRLIAAHMMMRELVRLYRRFAATYPREESAFPQATTGSAREDELRRLAGELRRMEVVAPALVDRLEEDLRSSLDESVVHMRPFVLAEVWQEPRLDVLRLFLYATHAGLLDLEWSILCPNCRVAKATTSSLAALPQTAHYDLCHIQFGVNFDEYVELRFTVNAAVRHAAAAVYCVGGPTNTRHILVQRHLRPGQECTVRLSLEPGDYRIRTRQLRERTILNVAPAPEDGPPFPSRGTVRFGEAAGESKRGFGRQGHAEPATLTLAPGEVSVTLRNEGNGDLLALIERASWCAQHVSAALVTSLSEFRRLFSSELLATAMAVASRNLTLRRFPATLKGFDRPLLLYRLELQAAWTDI